MTSQRFDPLATIAVVITLIMTAVYIALISQQGGDVAVWFLVALAVAAVLGGYGAVPAVPGQTAALAVSGAVLVVCGVLGILTIGLPIIVAGVLALVAAGRSNRGRVQVKAPPGT